MFLVLIHTDDISMVGGRGGASCSMVVIGQKESNWFQASQNCWSNLMSPDTEQRSDWWISGLVCIQGSVWIRFWISLWMRSRMIWLELEQSSGPYGARMVRTPATFSSSPSSSTGTRFFSSQCRPRPFSSAAPQSPGCRSSGGGRRSAGARWSPRQRPAGPAPPPQRDPSPHGTEVPPSSLKSTNTSCKRDKTSERHQIQTRPGIWFQTEPNVKLRLIN